MPFYLKSFKKAPKSGEVAIFLQIGVNNKIMKHYTGLKIKPEHWDQSRQRPIRNFRLYRQFSSVLETQEAKYFEIYWNNKISTPANLEPDTLKKQLVIELKPKKVLTIADYADDYILKKKGIAATTVNSFQNLAKNIRAFNPDLTFDQLTIDKMEEFKQFLLHKGGDQGKGYGQNSVHFMFKKFKTVLNSATLRKLNTNLDYKSSEVKVGEVETTAIFLDEKELMTLWNTKDLPENLEPVRDAFLVSCYTGVRYEDIAKINATNFYDDNNHKYFRVKPKKDVKKKTVDIPIHPFVFEIMKKYQWKIPMIANATFNEYIKEVGQIAGINRDIEVSSFKNGIEKKTIKKKYKLITAHTGRRSLVCNLHIAGWQHEDIKAITGHKDHNSFLKYLRLTPQDHLEIAYKSDFFKPKLHVV